MTPEAQIEIWFTEILAKLSPRRLTRDAISLSSGLHLQDAPGEDPMGEVVIVAIGKAAIAMATGAQDAMGMSFQRGFVLTVEGPDAKLLDERWTIFRGGHPIPDQTGIDATRAIVDVVERLQPEDVVVALISGGGSALFESPRAPLTLADFAEVTRLLLNAGAPIQHLNTVRIPLSEVKGGSLRQGSPAGRFLTLILSDVMGNNPQIIASGPTVEPATTGAAALAVLDIYGLRETVPSVVRGALNEAADEETNWEHPDDLVEIVGDVQLAIALAGATTDGAGIATKVIELRPEGEASEMARAWVVGLTHESEAIGAMWSGGEHTVTVKGQGSGGRNTEFALAAALELERIGNDEWVVASLATDGQDGTSGSAGAIASWETIVRARAMGLDPEAALAANDSGSFFERAGGLVTTGPSGTNVNDLYLGLRRSALQTTP